MNITTGQLAERLGCRLIGNAQLVLDRLGEVTECDQPGVVVLATEPKALKKLKGLAPRVVILKEDIPELTAVKLITNKGKDILIDVLTVFFPEDSTGFVSDRASIDPTARVGKNAKIYPGVFIGKDVVIGDDVVLYPGVVIYEKTRIGQRCIIHANAVIGSDGFGYIFQNGQHRKVPQKGIVIIEDDVEIGAATTIDRATISATVIGAGTKIDNKVLIAHNVIIGKNCILAGSSNIAGSSILEDGVILAGGSGVSDNVCIGAGAIICAYTVATSDVPPKTKLFATPTGEEYMTAMRRRAKLNKIIDA
jgi:UDP-3-O-[3-hydroxymyristoyl] glucosamine N-acyltransferase